MMHPLSPHLLLGFAPESIMQCNQSLHKLPFYGQRHYLVYEGADVQLVKLLPLLASTSHYVERRRMHNIQAL